MILVYKTAHSLFDSASAFSDGHLSVFSLVTPARARHCRHSPESDRPQYIGLPSEDLRADHWEKVAVEHTLSLPSPPNAAGCMGDAAQIRQICLGNPNSSAAGQTHSAPQTILIHSSSGFYFISDAVAALRWES